MTQAQSRGNKNRNWDMTGLRSRVPESHATSDKFLNHWVLLLQDGEIARWLPEVWWQRTGGRLRASCSLLI